MTRRAICGRHWLKGLNKLYQPTKFVLSRRYGQMMCVVFYTIVFCSAAPMVEPRHTPHFRPYFLS